MTLDILTELTISFIGSIPALILALWIDKQRMPKLRITTSEGTNSDVTYPQTHGSHSGERWKFFRVEVKNEPFSWPFHWIPRQTAENCRANIDFVKIGTPTSGFSMLGRWSSSLELPYLSGNNAILKVLYPDPATIPINESEILDIIAKCGSDTEAYAWNNEAYLHNWRSPSQKLAPGNYSVKVTIVTQNGSKFIQKFELTVASRVEDTHLITQR